MSSAFLSTSHELFHLILTAPHKGLLLLPFSGPHSRQMGELGFELRFDSNAHVLSHHTELWVSNGTQI